MRQVGLGSTLAAAIVRRQGCIYFPWRANSCEKIAGVGQEAPSAVTGRFIGRVWVNKHGPTRSRRAVAGTCEREIDTGLKTALHPGGRGGGEAADAVKFVFRDNRVFAHGNILMFIT